MLIHSVVSDSLWPQTVAHQATLSTGFPRQEYWSGWPFPLLGDRPDPEIEPESPVASALAGGFFTIWNTQEALPKQNDCLNFQALNLKFANRSSLENNEKKCIDISVSLISQESNQIPLFASIDQNDFCDLTI